MKSKRLKLIALALFIFIAMGPLLSFAQTKPNLTAQSHTFWPDTGQVSFIKVVMEHNGDPRTPTGKFGIGFYASPDTILSRSEDSLVREINDIPSLNKDETYSIEWTMPRGFALPPGKYYMGYYIDHQDSVDEKNEGDNSFLSRRTITVGSGSTGRTIAVEPLIYPNPVESFLTLDFATPRERTITIYNYQGSSIDQRTVSGSRTELIVAHYVPGVYFVKVDDGSTVWYKRIVKSDHLR